MTDAGPLEQIDDDDDDSDADDLLPPTLAGGAAGASDLPGTGGQGSRGLRDGLCRDLQCFVGF